MNATAANQPRKFGQTDFGDYFAREHRLTDGSKVYDVCYVPHDLNAVTILNATSEADALSKIDELVRICALDDPHPRRDLSLARIETLRAQRDELAAALALAAQQLGQAAAAIVCGTATLEDGEDAQTACNEARAALAKVQP